jgi:hypothetical protein
LNGAEIRTSLEQVSGEAVTQDVWMDFFLEARSQSGFLTRIPSRFRVDGLISTEFLEQLRAEHHIAISASLAALDVDHHALAVDVADFQVCQLGVPGSGGVERHQ